MHVDVPTDFRRFSQISADFRDGPVVPKNLVIPKNTKTG
jgi:hypothetical protein